MNGKHQTASGYKNSWEYYADELKWLDLKLQMLIDMQQDATAADDNPMDPFRGLVVSEQEVQRLLSEPMDPYANHRIDPEWFRELQALEETVAEQVEQSWRAGVFLPLPYLVDVFQLSPFEYRCLLICLAIEFHRKYEKLYAFLQDDVTCKHPTVDLVLKCLCHSPAERIAAMAAFSPNGKLFTYFFKNTFQSEPKQTLSSMQLQLDGRIVRFLLYNARTDEEIARFAEVWYPTDTLPDLLWEEQIPEQLRTFVAPYLSEFLATDVEADVLSDPKLVFLLKGHSGAGKKLQVKHFCQRSGKALVSVDLEKMMQEQLDGQMLFERVVREAILHQAVLCFHQVQVLLVEESQQATRMMQLLLDAVQRFHGLVFLLSERAWRSEELHRQPVFLELELEVPSDGTRQQLWQQISEGYLIAPDLDWASLASKFRFTVGQMQRALAVASNLATWQAPSGGLIDLNMLYQACYTQIQHHLEKKAKRIQPRAQWDDLVLPEEQKESLRNAANQMKYRSIVYGDWGFAKRLSYGRGLSMLFAGPPGTGKTMAAEVIARELGSEIYKIDLSQVISKYIGETEKNLHEIFSEAQLSSAILFFDEADALFGKRSEVKDAHDKYANVETAYLLQKMEEYEGITILASNYQQNLDEAFMRRLNYVIKFPFPDADDRERIWRGMFPQQTPLASDVDFPFIAEKFEIAGGNIKNIVLSAAFLAAEANAPVSMSHIARAIKHELKKTGKLVAKKDLEDFFSM